ncbi:Protein of unknown function [Cotesia congregata]|uniref:Mab-21-like HhH/H2TH-like domain-containing protein n=1 Tax=Cotesia congregata TaxID=51543 RepID=A0A8J2HPD2_COTCN|nr:Protein of unknown function [Cotesia congregata]
MGCATSATSGKGSGTRLIATKLTFTCEQLENLNGFFRKTIESTISDKEMKKTEATVERLIQRLLAAVGKLDPRFSSMFLQLKFEYLLRMDALSSPMIDTNMNIATVVNLEEDAALPGFARLRIRGVDIESWAEFLGPGGRLRRDLVKAKLVNLLAAATKQETINMNERTCQSPGQIVDAETLDKILKQPDHCRVFYGPAAEEKELPLPRDHRIVLVEDATGILIRISLNGHKIRDVEVRLIIGVGVSLWSSLADYPGRVPLYHCDALLHYTAAQSGMYAVAVGPYPSARCDDRATLWRLRAPAAETIMSQHYSDESVPALTESVLMHIVDQLRGRLPLNLSIKQKDILRVVSRHIVRTIHWWSLERAGPDPLRSWSPDSLSRHVLLALDELVTALRCQSLRCYFHPRCNVMLQCAKGGILHHEDSYVSDARLLELYLLTLHQYSLNLTSVDPRPSDILESELIVRWRQVMASLPRGTMGGHYGYSTRQLMYLGIVIKQVLKVKELVMQNLLSECSFLNLSLSSDARSSPTENLVYLLTLVLKQARDQIYAIMDRHKNFEHSHKKSYVSSRSKKQYHTTYNYFEHSVDILIDIVRRDRETAYTDLENDVIMSKSLLRWLYFGNEFLWLIEVVSIALAIAMASSSSSSSSSRMEYDKKVLGHILRPYLGNLFNSSHENAWQVQSWRKRQDIYNTEMRSLSLFCKLVTTQETSPAAGIVESLSKGWTWAEQTINMIERSPEHGLRLLFITPDRVIKYSLTFTNNRGLSAFSSWSKARNIGNITRRATIARTTMITATDFLPKVQQTHLDQTDKGYASYVDLRDSSPLTYVVSINRRRGRQRGPGGLIPALVTLNKFRILQEAAAVLPHDERVAMLDAVQKVSREASRRFRRTSCPDLSGSNGPKQTYTPRSDGELLERPLSRLSPSPRQRGIIDEHQKQLHREIMEIHDTLTRGLRPRNCISTAASDSTSTLSWTSSIRSAGKNRLMRTRNPIWDTVRGTSTMWDRISTDGNFVTKSKSDEMISREESPKWSNSNSRQSRSETGLSGDEILPSWDFLETTLNRKLLHFDKSASEAQDTLRDDISII